MSDISNPFESLLPPESALKAEESGAYKATKPPLTTFFLAITAGVFIAIAFTFYLTVTLNGKDFPFGVNHFIGGAAFSLGLILVVICGADLFTSSTLTVIAKASNKITWGELLKNWFYVYFGNMAGALFFAVLLWLAGQHMVDKGQFGFNTMLTAQHKLHHTFVQAVALGILCNLLVCLTSWMVFSCRTVSDKVLVIILPITMFVACGFEHCVANMFIIPMAIIIHYFATPEFWTAISATGHSVSEFTDLTVYNFIVHNLIPVTIGNIIGGGVLVGMTYWGIYRRPGGQMQHH